MYLKEEKYAHNDENQLKSSTCIGLEVPSQVDVNEVEGGIGKTFENLHLENWGLREKIRRTDTSAKDMKQLESIRIHLELK